MGRVEVVVFGFVCALIALMSVYVATGTDKPLLVIPMVVGLTVFVMDGWSRIKRGTRR